MFPLLRLLTLGLFLWRIAQARAGAAQNLGDDLGNAWNFVLVILSGLLVAVTWAPLLGSSIAQPISGILTDGSCFDHSSPVMRLLRWCERRRMRKCVLLLCFIEGVRFPRLPAAFITGLHYARPGSWLERAFAREVYKFSNVAHAAEARSILRSRHGRDPGPHHRVEVNLALLSDERVERPTPPALPVPPATPPPPLVRNRSIRLFTQRKPAAPESALPSVSDN